MATRGPKPKPTALKILAGVAPGRINHNEPRVAPGIPDPPSLLGPVALAEWHRMVALLSETGVLTRIDGAALAIYCQHFARWTEAEEKLIEFGMVTPTGTGSVKSSPYLQIAEVAMRDMTKLLTEFGCTPSSRSRVVAAQKPETDELGEFLARSRATRKG